MKVLILSYHFPPLNVIASYRAKGFADHLYRHGIHPTIVTHRWESENSDFVWHTKNDDVFHESNSKYDVYRLPRIQSRFGRFLRLLGRFSLSRNLQIVLCWMFGHLDARPDLLESYLSYKAFIKKHLTSNHYEIAIGIYSPHNHHRICFWLKRKYNMDYILDYRDLWDNRVVDPLYQPSRIEGLRDFIFRRYWRKWLDEASFFTIATNRWKQHLQELTDKPGYVIMNGFEAELFNSTPKQNSRNNDFVICHSGTVYPHQNIEHLLSAVLQLNDEGLNIKLTLIGVRSNLGLRIKSFFKESAIPEFIEIRPIIEREKAIEYIKNSEILYYPIWPRVGHIGGKLFEYLATGNTVLAYPDDRSEVSNLISVTNCGFVVSSKNELKNKIAELYADWIAGRPNDPTKSRRINDYTRENQTTILAEQIVKEIN